MNTFINVDLFAQVGSFKTSKEFMVKTIGYLLVANIGNFRLEVTIIDAVALG